MYKVIIVEDEIPIRNIIVKIIDWNQLGFELVYQADNGQMALAYLQSNPVDLVITDISMPFMDGLDLCKNISEYWPDTTIIILSGHSEFNYAQKAISLGVSNYISKPVTKASFSQTLNEIKSEMDEKMTARKNLDFLRKQYHQNKDLLKNKFFNNLIMGYNQNNLYDQKSIIEENFAASAYIVASLILEDDKEELEGFWGKDRPLLEFAVLNLVSELFNEIEQDIVFLGPGNQICFILKLKDNNDSEYSSIIQVLERSCRLVEELFSVKATIGVSDVCLSYSDLSFAYSEAVTALEYRVLEGSDRVILKSNMEGKSTYTVTKLGEQLTRLEYSIKVGDHSGTKKIITYIFSVINYERIDINGFRTFLMQIVITILKAYNDIETKEKKDILDYKIFSQLFEINDFEEIKGYLLNLCNEFSNKISMIRDDEDLNHVNEAIAYIKDNYQDPLLSLESLCKVLYLSSGHFSRLFKKSTGVTFIDYLTKVRIDQAKYLLANTSQKMYEISLNIGYEDPNYFSYNFKKNTGMTPSEWRKGK